MVRRFDEHYPANVERNRDAVEMTGTYITVISGLIALVGWYLAVTAAGIE